MSTHCEPLRDVCDEVLGILGSMSEAIGKGRGKGSGLARLLREAAYRLGDAASECIRGCNGSSEPRCVLGDLADRLQAVMQGAAIRLERVGRLGSEAEEELARILVDTLYSIVSSLCRYAGYLG